MQHPSSVDAYLRHGWKLIPIPPGRKGPVTKGWNQHSALLCSQADLPHGWGIGLAHSYTGTMALDVDDWNRAARELASEGIDLQALYDAPDAVVVDSGRQGHGKLLYAMPMGIPMQSAKLMDRRFNFEKGVEESYNYLDFRCATSEGLTVQDVLPPSIHPDTGQPYRWAGRGHWMRLPTIPHDLMQFWQRRLEASVSLTPSNTDTISDSDVEWDVIRDALKHISPDCSREEWITVGMALHYAGAATNQVEEAAETWNQWSAQSATKYPGARGMATQWRSFNVSKTNKVKLGSLFRMATNAGWVKPMPDVTQMFSETEVKAPVQLTNDLRPPPPELDLSLVPQVIRRRAEEIGKGVGCDPMVPLFAGIAAVCGAVDSRTRLQIKPGFKVPPLLWCMTIGEPADKKSPGSRPMFKVLDMLEHEDRPRYRQALQMFEAEQARYEATRKAFLDAAKDVNALLSGEMPNGYGDAPMEPKPLKIVVQDITSQKLVRHAADMPRGLLCYLDEMHSWAEKIVDPRSGEVRSAWTQSYEGERYEIDRVGAGTITAENFSVSIYGNIQPHVFSNVVGALSKDGLLQRFIPVVLRAGMTRKGKPLPDEMTNIGEYEQMIRTIYGMPAMTYHLSPEAVKLYDEFQDWYETQRADERLLRSGPIFMTAFGKVEGLTGRLALVWHMMSEPFSQQVSAETMRQVIQLVRSYVIPAFRYTYDSDLGGVSGFDQWIADYVIQHADMATITLSEIKRSARRQIEKMSTWSAQEMIIVSMHPLQQAGWVARYDDGSQENRGIAQWAVNPALREMFADHRRAVIEAKQRQMDQIQRNRNSPVPKVHGYEGELKQA